MIRLSDDAYDKARALLDRRLIVTVDSNEEVIEAIQDILLFARAKKISLNAAGELVQGEVDNWLPIESAPRDGASVLVWCPTDGSVIASWVVDDGCWFCMHFGSFDDATHWMPLPEPPK